MIAYLKGQIIDLNSNSMIILTDSGIGYETLINELTYSKLIQKNQTEVYIYHHITENSQSLFAFLEKEEKEVFKELIKISGVGGKVAINILNLGIEKLIQAIKFEEENTIVSVPGIGKKMASKLILELKDKDLFKYREINIKNINNSKVKIESSIEVNVIDSLTNMGYKKQDIEEVLSRLPENITNLNEIIPFVIKNIK